MASPPDTGDVVIRQKRGNPSSVYLLGTPAVPDQFIVRSPTKPSRTPLPMPCISAWSTRHRDDTMTDWLDLIRAEYFEIPGLHLTRAEAERLWNLETTVCEAVHEALETAGFLRRTQTGAYVNTDA